MSEPLAICTICARGGSKGVPGKNLRPLLGRPLLAHSLAQARSTGRFAAIAVSSDAPEILDCARAWGADLVVQRPGWMASDDAAKPPAIRHCVETAEQRLGLRFDLMVDLDATAPLREPEDILACIGLLQDGGCDNVISVSASRKSPYFNLVELTMEGFARLSKRCDPPVVRRQDSPACFDINGSVYAWHREGFLAGPAALTTRTRLYVMPEERSFDIDTETDWTIVEALMRRRLEVR
jgi:CMP-N,N'-diacetyllegionaminic acid synthase